MTSDIGQVTLDRGQRAAVRHEIAEIASIWANEGDLVEYFRSGDREEVRRIVGRLGLMIDAMDVIGWSEQEGAPALQQIGMDPSLRAWARHAAGELGGHDGVGGLDYPGDQELDAYAALRVIGGEV
jgi:hypothetical protein